MMLNCEIEKCDVVSEATPYVVFPYRDGTHIICVDCWERHWPSTIIKILEGRISAKATEETTT